MSAEDNARDLALAAARSLGEPDGRVERMSELLVDVLVNEPELWARVNTGVRKVLRAIDTASFIDDVRRKLTAVEGMESPPMLVQLDVETSKRVELDARIPLLRRSPFGPMSAEGRKLERLPSRVYRGWWRVDELRAWLDSQP